MFSLWKDEKDRRYIYAIIIIMLCLKILGTVFVTYYAYNGKTREGLIFRNSDIIGRSSVSPTVLALGYHWDSIHYVNTSQMWEKHFNTAGQLRNAAYLFPLMIMGVSKITGKPILTAVILSNLFSMMAVLALYCLCRIYTSRFKSFAAAMLFMTYPAFFATGLIAYSEPVYICFAIMSWYFFEKERYPLSALFCGFALCTRVSGVILLAVYAIAFIIRAFRESSEAGKLRLPPWGILWYALPIVFLILQTMATKHFVVASGIRTEAFHGFIPALKGHFTPVSMPFDQFKYFKDNTGQGLEMYMYIIPAFMLGIYLRRFRTELTIYVTTALLAVICISSEEVFRAFPRHILNAWPFFIALGDLLTNRWILATVCTFFFLGGLKLLDFYFTCCYI